MELSNISKYRKLLMGISIVMIMLCHNSLVFGLYFNQFNNVLRSFLQIGVDIFFMLSGLGCYFSMKKNPQISVFYKKRFFRIVPTYLFVIILYGIFNCVLLKVSLNEYIFNYSLITFFTSGLLKEWFIAAILVLYILFPILFSCLEKHPKKFLIVSLIILMFSIIISFFDLPKNLYTVNEIFVSRIATFCLGIFIGKKIYEKENIIISKKSIYIMLTILIVIWLLNYYFNTLNMMTMVRIIFLPLQFYLIMLFIFVFRFFENQSVMKRINDGLSFIGAITLEIYLIHEKLMGICYFLSYLLIKNESFTLLISNIMAILIAPLGAYIIHQIINYIFNFKLKNS